MGFPSENDRPVNRVRCPVHGFIHYSNNEQKIIDHPVFQRLRYIHQLGLTYYVYPGAMHTRFEHSLGVMHLASKALDILVLKHGEELKRILSEYPPFNDNPLEKARQVVRLYGLLHDVGHAPFSHAGEVILPGGKSHEDIAVEIIRTKLNLDDIFFEGVTDILCGLIEGKGPPQPYILQRIISGPMDMDRVDYLLRDSLHCGVEYGKFDHPRLLESLILVPIPEQFRIGIDQPYDIGIEPSGIFAFESLIFSRYQMTVQVYHHKLRRIYDLVLAEYLKKWVKRTYSSTYLPEINDLLKLDDLTILSEMRNDSIRAQDQDIKDLAKILTERQHPYLVLERRNPDPIERKRLRQVLKDLNEKFSEDYFWLDDQARLKTHTLYVPNQHYEEQEEFDELFVYSKKKDYVERVTKISDFFQTFPRRLTIERVFVTRNPHIEEIREFAEKTMEVIS